MTSFATTSFVVGRPTRLRGVVELYGCDDLLLLLTYRPLHSLARLATVGNLLLSSVSASFAEFER